MALPSEIGQQVVFLVQAYSQWPPPLLSISVRPKYISLGLKVQGILVNALDESIGFRGTGLHLLLQGRRRRQVFSSGAVLEVLKLLLAGTVSQFVVTIALLWGRHRNEGAYRWERSEAVLLCCCRVKMMCVIMKRWRCELSRSLSMVVVYVGNLKQYNRTN